MTTMTRAGVLINYIEVAKNLGINPIPLMRKANLSRVLLEQPEQRIPIGSAVQLLEDSAQESGCISFGLRMAESRQLSDIGVLSLLLVHQPTLRDAIKALVQYRHLLNDSLAIYVEEFEKTIVIREEVVTDRAMATRQATELAIGVMYRLCSKLLGHSWNPRSINFTHEPPSSLDYHRRFFRCNLVFGAEFNGIVCPAVDLDKPNLMAEPALASFAQHYVETLTTVRERSVVLDVRKAIYLLLPLGRASIEQIAESLGTNVRTLQRRLEGHGETFSDLSNCVRRELAMRYINNENYSISQIADLLGYSMPSSLTRWFSAEFGVSPKRWRALNQSSNPS
ncbi:AraC family transcriptional regulator [Photobacterium sp. TY1-4]|uniref:AraC family transcriptional regulator n=1 Tax=Photobacterium sp. TY1-4 TaxID=2899122 RepID=UPI0021C192B0|nr:AraC family transcriptional regulator [Photobacterium sp. TY1-4]UXI04466.1 AraC family transcriptional regulator [Photobacterium sp. TY1-4]